MFHPLASLGTAIATALDAIDCADAGKALEPFVRSFVRSFFGVFSAPSFPLSLFLLCLSSKGQNDFVYALTARASAKWEMEIVGMRLRGKEAGERTAVTFCQTLSIVVVVGRH